MDLRIFNPEEKAKAMPRIITACVAAETADDLDLFWTLAGLIRGGLNRCQELPELADKLKENVGNFDNTVIIITQIRTKLQERGYR